jgi:hypothetical protein
MTQPRLAKPVNSMPATIIKNQLSQSAAHHQHISSDQLPEIMSSSSPIVSPLVGLHEKMNSETSKLQKSTSRENLSQLTHVTEATSHSDQEDVEVTKLPHTYDFVYFLNTCDKEERDSYPTASIHSKSLLSEPEDRLPEGMPNEIVVISDSDVSDASSSEIVDIRNRLKFAETLVASYKAKMESTENLADTLSRYLRKTQDSAERSQLLNTIQDMEKQEKRSNDVNSLLKMMMCLSLFSYFCGRSELFLVASVGAYLMVDVMNAIGV